MTGKRLLTIIYELSQVIPRQVVKTKELLNRVELEERSFDKAEVNLLLYNLEDMGHVSLTHSSKTGIINVYLTERGKRKAAEG